MDGGISRAADRCPLLSCPSPVSNLQPVFPGGGSWSSCDGMLRHRAALGTGWGCFSPAPSAGPQSLGNTYSSTCFQGSTCAAVFLEKGKSRAGPEADAASGVEEQQYWAARGGTGCVHGVAQSKHRARAEHTATGSVRNYSCGAQYQIHFDVICHMVLVYRYGLHVSPIVCCKVIPGQQSHQVVDSCRSYCTEQYFIQSS